jgi:hypothetical protein
VIDYDDVNAEDDNGFWNLSEEPAMYGNADFLPSFRLMPLEPRFRKAIEAKWDFEILDMKQLKVYFSDASIGKITSWKWDFGDGTTSAEQSPVHQYKMPGKYIVTLWVEGPAGKSRCAKVWDVALK